MQTPLAAKVLAEILIQRGWNQVELAAKSGLATSIISWHLSRQRPIRDEHFISYMAALHRGEQQRLTAAWMRDTLSPETITNILDVTSNRLREEVTAWSPGLTLDQERMLTWWKETLARDPELADIFRGITLKAGYPNPYEGLTVAVIVTDSAGLTTYANPAFTKMCGYPLEKLRGRKPGALLQGPETERDIIDEFSDAIAARRYFECPSLTNYHADGTLYRVRIKMHPIFDSFSTLIEFRAIEEKLA